MTIRKCHRCKFDSDESSKSFWKRFDNGLKQEYICRECIRSNSSEIISHTHFPINKKILEHLAQVFLAEENSIPHIQREYKVTYATAKKLHVDKDDQ